MVGMNPSVSSFYLTSSGCYVPKWRGSGGPLSSEDEVHAGNHARVQNMQVFLQVKAHLCAMIKYWFETVVRPVLRYALRRKGSVAILGQRVADMLMLSMDENRA